MNDNIKGVKDVGKAIYPHLNKPDTRFQKEGVYKVTLELTPDNSKSLIKNALFQLLYSIVYPLINFVFIISFDTI